VRRSSVELTAPGVLDGDDGLVGESLEQRDLVVGEAAGLAAGHRQRPDGLVLTKQRYHHHAPVAGDTRVLATSFGESEVHVRVEDIDRRSIANGLPVRPWGVERTRVGRGQDTRLGGVGAHERAQLALLADDPGEQARVASKQSDGTLYDRVEHRLHVRPRAADHAQDLARRGLLVQRLGEIAVARLDLRE
jgi:hypothetical protein